MLIQNTYTEYLRKTLPVFFFFILVKDSQCDYRVLAGAVVFLGVVHTLVFLSDKKTKKYFLVHLYNNTFRHSIYIYK